MINNKPIHDELEINWPIAVGRAEAAMGSAEYRPAVHPPLRIWEEY